MRYIDNNNRIRHHERNCMYLLSMFRSKDLGLLPFLLANLPTNECWFQLPRSIFRPANAYVIQPPIPPTENRQVKLVLDRNVQKLSFNRATKLAVPSGKYSLAIAIAIAGQLGVVGWLTTSRQAIQGEHELDQDGT